MTMIKQNFTMYTGETKNLIIDVTNEDNSLLDLTGATVKWGIRISAINLITKSTPDITIDGNIITINLKPSDTANITGTYYHECEVTDVLGNVSTIFTGTVTIKKSIM